MPRCPQGLPRPPLCNIVFTVNHLEINQLMEFQEIKGRMSQKEGQKDQGHVIIEPGGLPSFLRFLDNFGLPSGSSLGVMEIP